MEVRFDNLISFFLENLIKMKSPRQIISFSYDIKKTGGGGGREGGSSKCGDIKTKTSRMDSFD